MTDAKPATDEEITAIRMTLPEQAHQMSPAALVMQLIARIDAERAARLAAEARVKVLTEALRSAHKTLDYYAMDWTPHDEGLRARGILPVIETDLGAAFDWKPGDRRCDACDNGVAPTWPHCAWCGAALKEPAND